MICFEWTTGFIPTKKQEQESEADYKKFHLFIDLPLITKYFGQILSCVQIWRENEMYRLKVYMQGKMKNLKFRNLERNDLP